jgi:hypothetical protein
MSDAPRYIVGGVANGDVTMYRLYRAADMAFCAFKMAGEFVPREWARAEGAIEFANRIDEGLEVDDLGCDIEWAPDDRRLH